MVQVGTFPVPPDSPNDIWIQEELIDIGNYAYQKLSHVVTPSGILASEDHRFHHLFGRDTYVVAHFINAAYQGRAHDELWDNTRAAIFGFWDFQREDGKIRHEIKPFNREEWQKTGRFYYKVGKFMVNDDSVDATPLALIVTPEFFQTKEDLLNLLPKAMKALDWIKQGMDKNNSWLTYKYNPYGLTHQGWMDSKYAVMLDNGELPKDPISMVEVQAFAWKAMHLWSDLLRIEDPNLSSDLIARANDLKKRFNKQFLMQDDKGIYLAHALDADGNRIKNVSINPGLVLWANYHGESLIDKQFLFPVVVRLRKPEMFDENAGIRTFELGEPVYDEEGYHNGENVYWPIATAMVAKGMLELGFTNYAEDIMLANLPPIKHFGSFIEQFMKNGSYSLFRGGGEDGGCHN
ncbi:MAG: hypothetical protein Q7S03_01835 [bacterium]|nr:hypothetical protein [bacterium]